MWLHGVSNFIVSNQDSKFLANFWTILWRRFSTSLKYSRTTHPQINGQTKVVNHTLDNLFRSICGNKRRAWDQDLSQTEFAYNSTVYSSTGMSHFLIVYRKVPQHLLDLAKPPIVERFSNLANAIAGQVLDVQESVRLKLEKSNAKYKATTDKKRREKSSKKETWWWSTYGGKEFLLVLITSWSQRSLGHLRPWRRLVIMPTLWIFRAIAMSKTFNVPDLYAFHSTQQLYPENNSRTSSFEERGTNIWDWGNGGVDTAADTY